MKRLSILGATGSIGTQTFDVIGTHPEEFSVVALSFGENIERALPYIRQYRPKLVSVKNDHIKERLRSLVPSSVEILSGIEGLVEVATHPDADMLINAVLGSIGLEPTLAAIEAGKTIGLANKETLVTAGHLVMERVKEKGVTLLPIDSEHSAIFQSMQGQDNKAISRLILTASGGSFRERSRDELKHVTVEDALKHPNWSMGAKITVDSATLMNKGLEVIEAHWLFNIPYEKIDTIIHKESIVHSLVEYHDKSVIAELGLPSMHVPIQYALSYPKRLELPQEKRLNLWELGALHFEKVDTKRFKCLDFAYQAGKLGGTAPAVLNAANEQAVEHFLNKRISFLQIEDLVERALNEHQMVSNPSLEDIREIDIRTRQQVNDWVKSHV
ncbi:1-deoxy-D-xylulose-5-phosphate reductoisomerase [Terrilactibacillus sp. BCM23-1]|uniref:1-deoxy-D-xylulose 5-phosphate reductoisomerase n=1 Tax=Terrilactibacillus tamarindi TaxID=2599694 RepID=A0A6N8CVE5_9BACI|nr:1-deoxy-D-xylulose-5-phosphate reductoisomerase [Terrilactibacillus tamarindi]MTT32246.1 1-deoxy-D-xylulose-5-phosphate reductoisomerase [Terrilactibacillus tamarindi]